METAYIIRNGVIIGSGTNSSLNPDSSSTYIINCTIVSETGLETEVTNYDGDFTKIKQTIADGGKVELRTNFNSSNYILEPSRIEENYVTFNTIDKNANITIKVTKYGINDVSYIDLNSNGGATIDDAVTSTDTTWSSKKTSDEIAEKVDKTDITTTIDSTSTDTQVPSAKSVNDKYEEANVYKGKYVGDLNDIPFIKSGVVYKYDIRSGNCTNTPVGTHGILYSTYFDSDNYCLQEFHSLQTNKASIYRRDKGTGVWSDWQELATMDKVVGGVAKYERNEHSTGAGSTSGIDIVTLPKGHKYIVVAHFQINKTITDAINMNGSVASNGVGVTVRYTPHNGGGADATLLIDATNENAVIRCYSHNPTSEDLYFQYTVQVMTLA